MFHHKAFNVQPRLARRTFLQLMASATGAALIAACKPITRPAEAPVTSNTPMTGELKLQKVVANGVELHYIEQGQGEPLVLVHGGLSDYRRFAPQMAQLAQNHRVIAYSQRYNYPNQNLPIVDDYTTLVDAQDLVAFLQALELEPSHIMGYSSGGYMALVMALEHPEMVRTLGLNEPPIPHWLPDLPGGDAIYTEFMDVFWQSVGDAFRQGNQELALRRSVEFFFGPGVLDKLPAEVRQGLEDNITSWEAFTTSRDTFPMIDKAQVTALSMPILLLTAENTLPEHKLVNAELARLLPQAKYVTIADATHEMWDEQPDACVEAILEFLQAQA
jgi:non-heme chloroperoxidase